MLFRSPAEDLMVAGTQYFTTGGQLPLTREHDPAPRQSVVELIEASARTEHAGLKK